MKLVDCYSAKSKIHGVGLFANSEIPEATVVLYWPPTEAHHLVSESKLPELVSKYPDSRGSICRLFGQHFAVSRAELEPDEVVNHSENPNLIYVFGICVSRRLILPHEELTVDYRFLGSPMVPEELGDSFLMPYTAKEATLRALQEMHSLVQQAELA